MMKKVLVLVLVGTLVIPVGLVAKNKRGADLLIEKLDGTQVQGELIAVKGSSLLVMERVSKSDVTLGIEDVRVITIVKKSKALLGAGVGFFVGGTIGAVQYAAADKSGFFGDMGPALSGAGIALLGLGVGALLGASSGADESLLIYNSTESEIQEMLEILCQEARVPDYD